MSARFRYALEPVRLARGWRRDALTLELAAHAHQVAAQEGVVRALQAQAQAAQDEWRALAASAAGFPALRARGYAAYLADLAAQTGAAQDQLAQRQAAYEDTRAAVLQAQRDLDAVERHRAQAERVFHAARAQAGYRLADELWITSRNRSNDAHQA